MQWKFIAPAAPHQIACAEALVNTYKSTLKKAVVSHYSQHLSYMVFLEVLNLMNQRPIKGVQMTHTMAATYAQMRYFLDMLHQKFPMDHSRKRIHATRYLEII